MTAAPTVAPSTNEPTSRHTGHLHAIDLARVLTLGLVISVHVISLAPRSTTTSIGAFVVVFHVSREVFFLITAFVLVYTYGRRRLVLSAFWRKRYLYVGVPYVAWSAIYFLADARHLDPVTSAARAFGHDLLTGGARYHLYFLLVSMQIYLVFPLLRWLLRATEGHHGVVLATSVLYELGVTMAIDAHVSPGGVLTFWLHNPNALLASYLGYVVAGGVAAWHFDRLATYTETHLSRAVASLGVGLAAGVGTYLGELYLGGKTPAQASAVFQPVVVLETATIAWFFLAVGLWWEGRGMAAERLVSSGADASFGIFLSHPLVLQGLLALGGASGVLTYTRALPMAAEIPLLLVVAVPLVYLLSGALSVALRCTPLSLVLTGRSASTRPPLIATSAPPKRPGAIFGGAHA